jgi:uncharacterized protein (TIGR01777 family)
MRIAITGASGLVGKALTTQLRATGHHVLEIGRHTQPPGITWDPAAGSIDAGPLEGLDAVVHLAGESIASRRWNDEHKRRIRDSRVLSTRLLASVLTKLRQPPKAFIAASAIGYYGHRGDETLAETSPPGVGFLPEVCQELEDASLPIENANIRRVLIRIGIALAREGGALASMLTPFRLGVGGVIGDGRQFLSWIALADLVRIFESAILDTRYAGPINAVAPHPVTNSEFTRALGRALHRPTLLPLPAWAARIALGEMADALLLASTRCLPKRLEELDFNFRHPTIDHALADVLAGR